MPQLTPAVSVLMTAYNRQDFIAEAIESVLRSSFTDFELIIVDDASTDGTSDIAATYAARDERVRVFVNESNLGDYPNRNKAAGHARGTWLKYLDSDDVLYPHGLEVMMTCVQVFPEAGLGLSSLPDPAGPFPRLFSPAEAYREHFLVRDLLGRAPGSAIIRRAAFESAGGFSGRRQVGDHELWLRMARRFPVVAMPTDLVWDRVHFSQERRYDGVVDLAVMHGEVLREALDSADCPLSPEERARALAELARRKARSCLHFLQKNGGLRAALEYRRRSAIPLRSVAAVALGTVSSALRPPR